MRTVSSKEVSGSDRVGDDPASSGLKKILRSVPQLRETYYLFKALPGLLTYRSDSPQITCTRDYEREDTWGYSSAWGKHHLRVLLDMLDRGGQNKSFRRGLEIGCGEGYVSEVVAPRCDHLLATDVVPIALDRARRRCSSFQQVHFAEWNLLTDPVSGPYDLILLMSVVEYFCSRRDFLLARNKVSTMLEPGGLLLTTTTLQNAAYDSAWWTKWLPIGGLRTSEFFAGDPTLEIVDMVVTATHQFTTFRKRQPT